MQLERIKWVASAVWVMAAAILGFFVRDLTWQIWAAFVALAVYFVRRQARWARSAAGATT